MAKSLSFYRQNFGKDKGGPIPPPGPPLNLAVIYTWEQAFEVFINGNISPIEEYNYPDGAFGSTVAGAYLLFGYAAPSGPGPGGAAIGMDDLAIMLSLWQQGIRSQNVEVFQWLPAYEYRQSFAPPGGGNGEQQRSGPDRDYIPTFNAGRLSPKDRLLIKRHVSTGTKTVASSFNKNTEQIETQTKSSDLISLERTFVSETATNFLNYLNSKNITFRVFLEEKVYLENFTDDKGNRGSYPKGSTARTHFVEMITPGYVRHGNATPMTNAQIKNAHPELTDEKINTMRTAFESNKNTRPFPLPLESNTSLSESDVQRAVPIINQIYSDTAKKSPLQIRENSGTNPVPSYNSPVSRSKASVPFVSPIQPSSANPGDLWYNIKLAKMFIFIKQNSQTYWVEL